MALSASLVWDVRNGGSDANGGGFRGGANLTTPSAPAAAISAGGAIANATYYVVVSLADGNGETPKSAETAVTSSGANHTITVTAPANPNVQGSTWNVYFGTTSGGPYFAGTAGTGLAFGANYAITATPPTTGTQAPGVDYSQQNAAQHAYTDVVIGTPNTTATSAARPFTPNDVGNVWNCTAGTGFTVQRAEIIGVTAAGVATFDKALGTIGSTGGTGNLGGALASPALAVGQSTAGNGVFIKYSATPYDCVNSNNVAGGNINNSAGPGWIVGHDATRDRSNTDANRPTLRAGANSMTVLTSSRSGSEVRQLILDADVRTSVTGLALSGNGSSAELVKTTSCTTGFSVTGGDTVLACEASGGATGFNLSSGAPQARYCKASSCTSVGFTLGVQGCFEGSVATGCALGFQATTSRADFVRCVAYGSTSHGFSISSTNTGLFINCISYGATGAGVGFQGTSFVNVSRMINCAAGNNGGGNLSAFRSDQTRGFITLTADPFTNAAGLDFSLNTTAGGGAALRAAGYPATFPGLAGTSYPDVGAYQHADPAQPAVTDVRFGTVYGGGTGTARIPVAADVRFGTAVDATTGTCRVPTPANVRDGIAVDAATGTMTVPLAADVESGVQFGALGSEYTGTFAAPVVGDVESGVQYGGGGTQYTGTFGVPATTNVKTGIQYGAAGTQFTGTLTVPSAGDLRSGVTAGGVAGTLGIPTEAQVEDGVGFGADGTEFTGTLVVSVGSPTYVTTVFAATGFALTSGGQSGSYLGTATLDDVSHVLQESGGALEGYYEFNVGAGSVSPSVSLMGILTGTPEQGNLVTAYGYDWTASAWVRVGTITSVGDLNDRFGRFWLTDAMVSGAGLVRLRLAGTGLPARTQLRVNRLFATADVPE